MPYSLACSYTIDPAVIYQISWLGSTGEGGVPQGQVGEDSAQRSLLIELCPAVGSVNQTEIVLPLVCKKGSQTKRAVT